MKNSDDAPSDQSLDDLIAKAVEAVAKGENADQTLEVMLSALPVSVKEKLRKKFMAALAKRNLKPLTGEADIPSRATLNRIRTALATSTRQMMDRVMQLVRARPDLANSIQQAGKILAQSGVLVDRVTLSEAELGDITPSAASGKATQDRGTGRT